MPAPIVFAMTVVPAIVKIHPDSFVHLFFPNKQHEKTDRRAEHESRYEHKPADDIIIL